MKIGASTWYSVLTKNPIESVKEMTRAGTESIEIVHDYPHFLKENEINSLKSMDVDYSLHCPFVGLMFVHPDPDLVKPFFRRLGRSISAAERIGATHCVIHGGKIPGAYLILKEGIELDEFIDLFTRRLKPVTDRFEDSSVEICIENLLPPLLPRNINETIKIKESFPQLGFCLDIAHSEVTGETPLYLEAEELDIDHVHLSDNDRKSDQHLPVGQGKIDFETILSKLKSRGYSGKLIIENNSLEDILRSVENLNSLLSKI